ncbi:MAG TPA: acyltransferase family protein [Dokdonella sp.]|uniref:acyltransferase family protein n=1 Tax=Dokdonella sp. TaxID=2291710 RepID=UPI002CDDACF8|nr:acyltransferase family protein [Dokdonella sp.]HUD41288.1 acyltransferase family protein [Dokdonella sp.]
MERRYDLDWVRVCAFGVLVLYHVGMYYVSWDWHVKSPQAGPALEPLMLLSGPWRLSLLFLVSGAATAFLLGKAQAAQAAGGRLRFFGPRSWRLLLPLAFGMLVIVPPQAYYELLDSRYPGGYHDGYLAFWLRYLKADSTFCDDDGCLHLPTWNHLWFVAYLWVYTMVLGVLAVAAPRAVERLRGGLARALGGWGLLVWPILFLAAARIALIGRFGSTHGLTDDWYNHVQYFAVFVAGFLIARSGPVWDAIERRRWTALGLALAAWAFIAWYFAAYADTDPPAMLRQAQRAIWAVQQWCAIVAVLGFARRFAAHDGPLLRYLVPAVFPVYILHQTLIVILAYQLRPLALPPLLEGPLLVVLTLAGCFGGYELIRRIGWLRPLFGLKARSRPDPRPVPAVP